MRSEELKKNLPPVFAIEEALALTGTFRDPHNYLMRITDKNELIRLRRGLYADPKLLDHFLIANRLLSPSYVSFETALSYYGMIPERVITTISVSTQKSRHYETPVGLFKFFSQNMNLFSSAYTLESRSDYYIRIATPEKALFDTISRIKTIARQLKPGQPLLIATEELRIEEASLKSLSKKELKRLAPLYSSGVVKVLVGDILKLK